MNKVAAEIIAGIIPNKMARNRWRGILRYGPLNALRLIWKLRKDKTLPTYNLAVCAIAKNEGQYFGEWIEWHRSKGVEKFYIYDNESDDNTKEVLAPYIEAGIVEYTYFPGKRKQLAAYDDCLEKHRLECRWLAIIDLDEFIVPLKDKDIPQFLSRFNHAPVVEINWLVYGSGGARKKVPGKIMDRFRFHSRPENILNRHVKSIVNPRRVFSVIGCHEVARINGKAYDSHGNVIHKGFRDREPQQDVIRINHYAVKSYEEFVEKQMKGRASGRRKTIDDSYFKEYDLNILEDETSHPFCS